MLFGTTRSKRKLSMDFGNNLRVWSAVKRSIEIRLTFHICQKIWCLLYIHYITYTNMDSKLLVRHNVILLT